MSQSQVAEDTEELSAYLRNRLPGFADITRLEKFSDGQSNPTYKMTAGDRDYVLRTKPPGKLLKSAHAIDREYRVMRALKATPVPVPEVLVLCEGDTPLGVDFFIMDFVDGNIHWNPALPDHSAERRRRIFNQILRTLAALHEVVPSDVGLEDYGRPGNYFERQVKRWHRQYLESVNEADPGVARIIEWLETHMLLDDGAVSLVHGDFRIDNLIFSKDDEQVLAILDWELSTLGHPYADLAYLCMQWRMPANGEFLPGLGGLSRAQLGIPSEEEFVNGYCALRGITAIENWDYYVLFSYFRLISILQGVVSRAEAGNASNPHSVEAMRKAIPQLTRDGLALII